MANFVFKHIYIYQFIFWLRQLRPFAVTFSFLIKCFIICQTRPLYFQDQSTNQVFNKTDNLNQEQFQSLILEEIARYYWRNLNLPITLTTCFWLIIVLNHLKTFTCSLFKLETGKACSKGRRRLQVRTISAREIRWPT